MNWFQFGRLIHSLYRRGGPLPDLDWIQSLGLLAVKLCQVHALRIDFLDREKCEHLARLYRQNTAMPAEDFAALLRGSGVGGLLEQLNHIDDQPLATASVGQVHRARLPGGDEVVVKAVKSDARAQFVADVASLKKLFHLATYVYPRLRKAGDPIGILEDVETYTLSELKLLNELHGQQRLRRIRDESADSFDLTRLKFPAIHTELSNDNVLVSDYVAGPSVDELLERGKLEYEQLLELFRLHGFYMFCAGTFHGDLHPGNVLVDGDIYYFIDTGAICSIEPYLRDGLFRFFSALAEYDYRDCSTHLNSMSITPLAGARLALFERDFLDLYSDFRGATVSDVSLTARMMQTIRLAVNSGMTFERSIFGIIRSLMYLDGMVLRCNPQAVLMHDMAPLLADFRATIGDESHQASVPRARSASVSR